jgi:GNAT superfamily N-acetyltransferase
MIIRNFEPKDAEAVSYVIRQTMQVSNSRDYPLERLEPLIEYFSPEKVLLLNEERHCLVAEVDNQVVGTAAIEHSDLVTFFVLPEYQRTGIGAQLLQAIEKVAVENKINLLKLEASLTGAPFYEKFGYRRTGCVKNGTAGKQIGLEKNIC